MLRKANLALGGSLDNAIVFTPDGMLNETPLRFDDEFVRHKILDIIGDLALLGMPIEGKITAEKSGHSVHASLMSNFESRTRLGDRRRVVLEITLRTAQMMYPGACTIILLHCVLLSTPKDSDSLMSISNLRV